MPDENENNDEIVDNEQTILDTEVDEEKSSPPAVDQKRLDELSQSQDAVNAILDEYDMDLDDLKDSLAEDKSLKDLIGGRDAKAIEAEFKKAETLDKYNEYWANEKEAKKREGEDESDTVQRLEKEAAELRRDLRGKEKAETDRQTKDDQKAADKKALSKFGKAVNDILDAGDIPDNVKPYMKKYLGVNNPFNEIDLNSKRQTKAMVKEGVEAFSKLEQAIIKNYKAGKTVIPKVKETDTDVPVTKNKKIKNTKDARKVMAEAVNKLLGSRS